MYLWRGNSVYQTWKRITQHLIHTRKPSSKFCSQSNTRLGRRSSLSGALSLFLLTSIWFPPDSAFCLWVSEYAFDDGWWLDKYWYRFRNRIEITSIERKTKHERQCFTIFSNINTEKRIGSEESRKYNPKRTEYFDSCHGSPWTLPQVFDKSSQQLNAERLS